MAKHKSDGEPSTAQGVELIDLVIARVREDANSIAGFCGDHPLTEARPLPSEALATLTFPSGKPLPPSLKCWLAFDASWLQDLGWFSSLDEPVFTPRRIDEIVHDEYDQAEWPMPWGEIYEPLADRCPECFLLPGGSDSRRIYAVTEPDALGEYPVLVVDNDDLPYTAVMYPGFDVFMADEAGFGIHSFGTYEDLFDDPRYAERLNQHAQYLFAGKRGVEIYDEEWGTIPDEAQQES
ncbi:MAG TPA: hypothetical protein VGP82_11235 [Ktedonobacterales bacterium]|jgi:hypothetical protein|nr:hypothetical protein [Ktedonobacterales bacterium]